MSHRIATVLILGALLCLAPARAHADGLFTPWIGVNFANEPADGRTSFGFSAAGMGGGVIGGEFDFGYSPSFFGDEDTFGDNNVLTLVGNLFFGDHACVRGDLRYFRAGFDDLDIFNTDHVDFWRASFGVTFR